MKVCPFCLGEIKEEAIVCLYCDSKLVGELDNPQLAGLKERFLASLIDLVVTGFGPFFVAFVAGFLMWTFTAIFSWHRMDVAMFFAPFIIIAAGVGFIMGIFLVVYYQIKWLSKRGQTIGKKIMRIRIVGLNDMEWPGLIHIFFLRHLSEFILLIALAFYCPYLLLGYVILNLVAITRKERRCVHDFLGKTRVIKILKHASPLKPKLKGNGHLTVKHKFINRFKK